MDGGAVRYQQIKSSYFLLWLRKSIFKDLHPDDWCEGSLEKEILLQRLGWKNVLQNRSLIICVGLYCLKCYIKILNLVKVFVVLVPGSYF